MEASTPPLSDHLTGILLVDEDRTSNFLAARLLRRLAPTTALLVADSVPQGLRLLHQVVAQATAADAWLVLLDVKGPGLQDVEFLTAYPQLCPAPPPHVAVVVLTTSLHVLALARLGVRHLFPSPRRGDETRPRLLQNLVQPF